MKYTVNCSTQKDILKHLFSVENNFIPRLSESVNLEEYSKKLYLFSDRYECWDQNELVGLIAAYNNFEELPYSYITNVSVCKWLLGKGIADQLMVKVIFSVKEKNISRIDLHVDDRNIRAISFYRKYNFKEVEESGFKILMSIFL